MGLICPYCDAEISERAIEAEDGCCPECGALISPEEQFEGEDDLEYSGDEDVFDEDDSYSDEKRDPFRDAFRDRDDDEKY